MRIRLIITVLFFLGSGCSMQHHSRLTTRQKVEIKGEILTQIESMNRAFESADPERFFSQFLHSDELAVASNGNVLSSTEAVMDTAKTRLSAIKTQTIITKSVKIYVIDKNAAVATAAFTADYHFKNGNELKNHPYALTILFVRTSAGWKIAHYHS